MLNLLRWVSPRSIKETLEPPDGLPLPVHAWRSRTVRLVIAAPRPGCLRSSPQQDVRWSGTPPRSWTAPGFVETGESKILTESGGRIRRQTSSRRGTWQFRATPSGQELALEGWLDSLTLTRRSPETAITPGHRWPARWPLSRDAESTGGHTLSQVHPFVPDEVAEVAGMTEALDDVFPPLAGRSLAEGETWTDSSGLTIRRLPDSAASGSRLHRFELESRKRSRRLPHAGRHGAARG